LSSHGQQAPRERAGLPEPPALVAAGRHPLVPVVRRPVPAQLASARDQVSAVRPAQDAQAPRAVVLDPQEFLLAGRAWDARLRQSDNSS